MRRNERHRGLARIVACLVQINAPYRCTTGRPGGDINCVLLVSQG